MKSKSKSGAKVKKASAPKLYKIEKGMAIPEVEQAYHGKPGAVALTMQVLELGQSFLVKDELEAVKARKTVQDISRRGGKVFTTRKVGKGVRIWRTK